MRDLTDVEIMNVSGGSLPPDVNLDDERRTLQDVGGGGSFGGYNAGFTGYTYLANVALNGSGGSSSSGGSGGSGGGSRKNPNLIPRIVPTIKFRSLPGT